MSQPYLYNSGSDHRVRGVLHLQYLARNWQVPTGWWASPNDAAVSGRLWCFPQRYPGGPHLYHFRPHLPRLHHRHHHYRWVSSGRWMSLHVLANVADVMVNVDYMNQVKLNNWWLTGSLQGRVVLVWFCKNVCQVEDKLNDFWFDTYYFDHVFTLWEDVKTSWRSECDSWCDLARRSDKMRKINCYHL